MSDTGQAPDPESLSEKSTESNRNVAPADVNDDPDIGNIANSETQISTPTQLSDQSRSNPALALEQSTIENSESGPTADTAPEIPPLPERLRSLRTRTNRPNYKDVASGKHSALLCQDLLDDPTTYSEAMERSDRELWLSAMNDEIQALNRNNVYVLVDRPKCSVVTCRWVFKVKRTPEGTIDRYRARLVARGYSQKYGIDYHSTYAPVTDVVTIRLLFAHAAVEGLTINLFDIKSAFLYGDLHETVYLEQPEGFTADATKVWLLKRSLYGLKQAPRQWNQWLTEFLRNRNLLQSRNDDCLFYSHEPLIIVIIYVDDGAIFTKDQITADNLMKALKDEFEVNEVNANSFLGFQIYRPDKHQIGLHQRAYIDKMVSKYNMDAANSVDSPISNAQTKDDLQSPSLESDIPYREAVGSLQYAAVNCRVDISFAVNRASRKVSNPSQQDWTNLKRIFRYLKDKQDLGLVYSKV